MPWRGVFAAHWLVGRIRSGKEASITGTIDSKTGAGCRRRVLRSPGNLRL